MSREGFQKMLVILGENYGQPLSKIRLQTLTTLAEKTFGFDHDWQAVTAKIAAQENFFPNIATVRKYLDLPLDHDCLTNRQKAVILVDRFLSYLNGSLSRAEISEYDLSYCRNKFNVDPFSFARGDVNVEFRRREWIEAVESDFCTGIKQSRTKLQESTDFKQLLDKLAPIKKEDT